MVATSIGGFFKTLGLSFVRPVTGFSIILSMPDSIYYKGLIKWFLIISLAVMGVSACLSIAADRPIDVVYLPKLFAYIFFFAAGSTLFMAVFLHVALLSLGGRGTILDLYKLLLWTSIVLPFVLLAVSLVAGMAGVMLSASSEQMHSYVWVQLLPLIYYILISIKLSSDFSWKRSFLALLLATMIPYLFAKLVQMLVG